MDKSTVIQKKEQTKITSKISISSEASPGQPVYIANVTIDASKITVKIVNPSKPGQTKEFPNSADGVEDLCWLLSNELVRGVRLIGPKKQCNFLALALVKQGIRPLITNDQNSPQKLAALPVIDEHVAGIDIGKNMIMVAVPPHLEEDHTRAFGTCTDDLEEIVKWVKRLNITKVAMESTSVYWIPLYDLIEKHGIKPLIINPKHVKTLPGRKTDVLDAQWLMRLLACGLLQGGFIPPREIRALRDLTRYRQDLMDRAGDSLNRMHKSLSVMNIQLSNAISDISGKSGTNIIRAIVNGERDPEKLATLADKRCKSSPEEIARALHGTYNVEQVFMLQQEQIIYDDIHRVIMATESKIKELLEKLPDVPNLPPLPESSKKQPKKQKKEYDRSPYSFDLRGLLFKKFGCDLTILPGIQEASAAIVLFETGGNMDAFPTSKHFASWSGLCPGNKISGGKILSGKSPKKFNRVGQACRGAAHANVRSDNAFGAQIRRHIRNGKTKKTARKATAHTICTLLYNMIKYGQEYVEQGAAAYDKVYEERKALSCLRMLRNLGYDCDKIAKKAA